VQNPVSDRYRHFRSQHRSKKGGGTVFLTSPGSVPREKLALGVLAKPPCQGCPENTVDRGQLCFRYGL
jgi:hypothetical protein